MQLQKANGQPPPPAPGGPKRDKKANVSKQAQNKYRGKNFTTLHSLKMLTSEPQVAIYEGKTRHEAEEIVLLLISNLCIL